MPDYGYQSAGLALKEASAVPGAPLIYQAKPWNMGVGVGVNF